MVAKGIFSKSVFPTRVGVDRPFAIMFLASVCFPHTRGGGPKALEEATELDRFPHTRGGGPVARPMLEVSDEFSPHAWGWTGGGL